APINDTYTFYSYQDNNSQVFIDGNLVVNGAACNSCERSGSVTLTEGWHTIRVEQYDTSANWSHQELRWSSSTITKDWLNAVYMGTEPQAHAQPSGATITLDQPGGGETFTPGMSPDITWSTVGAGGGDFVSVHVSQDGGATWRTIATDQP